MLLARVAEGLSPQHDGDCFVECIVAQPNLGRRAGVGLYSVEDEHDEDAAGCHHWWSGLPRLSGTASAALSGQHIEQYYVDLHANKLRPPLKEQLASVLLTAS